MLFLPQTMWTCVTFLKCFWAPEVCYTSTENCKLIWSCTDPWIPQGGFHSLLAHPLCGSSARLILQGHCFFSLLTHSLACHVVLHSLCSCSCVLASSESTHGSSPCSICFRSGRTGSVLRQTSLAAVFLPSQPPVLRMGKA